MTTAPMDHEKQGYVHPAVREIGSELAGGRISRREFVRTLALLGVSAPIAYATAGKILGEKPVSGIAYAQNRPSRGRLRCSMRVQDLKDPASFNWTQASNVSRQIYEYLVITGPDNITRPYLARRWSPSRDLKTWTFTLNQGIRWHNGDEFTTDDVIFNLQRWFDPSVGSSNRGLFAQLADESGQKLRSGSIEKVDKYTFRMHLNNPSIAIPENFYNYPTAIVHRGFDGDMSKNPNGTGPFTLDGFAIGERASVKRVPGFRYWGNAPQLERIDWYDHGENPQTWLAALASDQVDMLYELPIELFAAARRIRDVNIYRVATAVTDVIRMQVTTPPFDNKLVRQAIQACCDSSIYPRQLQRGVGLAGEHHHVCPVHPDYSRLPFPDRDVNKARRLLAEAGYPNGLEISIDCGNTSGTLQQKIVELFASQAREAGINVRLNLVPDAKYWDLWKTTPLGITEWTHRPLGTMVLSLAYRNGVPWNETNYSNPEFEDALNAAEAIANPRMRRQAMGRVERILQEDAIMVQPLWRAIATAARRRVRNLRAHPTRYQQFERVSVAG